MSNEVLTIDPTAAPLELATGSDGFYLRGFDSPPPSRKIVAASSQDTEGEIIVDSQYDPRVITALIRAVPGETRDAWYDNLDRLQQKIGKINEVGGVLARTLIGASVTGYYDLTGDAEANIPWDAVRYGKAGDVDISLSFRAQPFIRGDEIALTSHTESYLPCLVFAEIGLPGDVTGLGRLDLTNNSNVDQRTAWWGIQCENYDPSATATLFYEAEALTPLDQAVPATITGASGPGSNVVRHSTPSTVTWTPILSTDVAGVGKMTHRGTYRVLARIYATFTGAKPQVKFLYGGGDFTKTASLNTVSVQTTASFFIHDFGLVRLSQMYQWTGAFYGLAGTAGDTLSIDCIMLVPVDEGYGFAKAIQPPSSLIGLNSIRSASTSVDLPIVGSLAWTNPGNASIEDGTSATCTLGGETIKGSATCISANPEPSGLTSPYSWVNPSYAQEGSSGYAHVFWDPVNGGISQGLYATNFGFNIPADATITGIRLAASVYGGPTAGVVLGRACLVKAGSRVAGSGTDDTNGFNGLTVNAWGAWSDRYAGGSNDLWNTTLTPTDVNHSGFGVCVACGPWAGYSWDLHGRVDWISLAVYYTIETHYIKSTGFGFTLPSSTVTGISVSIKGYNNGFGKAAYQERVQIVKGGVTQSINRAAGQVLSDTNAWNSYGGENDLWGTSWAYTDINSANFGVVFSHKVYGDRIDGHGAYYAIANVDAVKITVYYTTSGGFQATADAVVFANGRVLRISDKSVQRQNLGGTFYSEVASYAGKYLRIPPSRQEGRAVRAFAKVSRSSDPPNVADSSIDSPTGRLFYTPRYLMMPTVPNFVPAPVEELPPVPITLPVIT